MSSTLIIDDNDPSVRYDPSWSLAEGPGYGRAYKLTLHSARDAGGSATVAFRGTGIQVVTMREPTSLAGYAVTSYYIDGEYITTVGSAFVPDGRSQSNVTVFAKRDLAFGTHLLNITNMNGTRPSTFWLDYFIVDTSPSDIVVTSSSSSSFASPTAGMSTSASQSSLSKRIPAIAGAVAGALIVIVAVALGCLWRRRRVRVRKEKMLRADVQPYVPVVRIISQYRASLHSLEKVSPSIVEGTYTPSAPPEFQTPGEANGSGAHLEQTLAPPRPRSKRDSGSGAPSADLPEPPAPLLVVPGTIAQAPATGLVLPDELGRALSDASPEVRTSVMSFMHTLLLQGGQQRLGRGVSGEVNSGVRMYDDDDAPPRYTSQ